MVLITFGLTLGVLGQEAPQAPPAPAERQPPVVSSPAPPTPELKVDMGRIVAMAVAQILATPRFEEQVEVRDRFQDSLDRYLVATDVSCGATESGPPPQDELNRFRAHPIPPHADLLAGFRWLHRKLRASTARKNARFFLYWVHLKGAPERFVYVVREGPMSENDRALAPETEWELLAGFVDGGIAADTLSRLQRGVSTPSSPQETRGMALWAMRKCSR